MSITDYASLKTAVAARAVRTDLTALIPDFIRAAHDVIVAKMALATPFTVSAATFTAPSDFRLPLVIILGSYTASPLALASPAQLQSTSSGLPRYYTVSGATITVYPSPSQAYTGQMLYRPVRTPFSADADTNTVLDRYPSLYLYGSMAELFAHTRNAEERDRYLQLFLGGIDTANQTERSDLYASATLQSVPGMVV